MSTPQPAQQALSQANRNTVLAGMTPQKLQQIMQRANALRSSGQNETTSQELKSLMHVMRIVGQHQAQAQAQ
jgi:hypothetical protein